VRPIHSVLLALAFAIGVNVFVFSTRTGLSAVAGQTLFANCMVVLTLVPLYMVLLLKSNELPSEMPHRVKAGLKAVAIFALLMAVVTFLLFSTLGEYLIYERLQMVEQLLKATELSTEEQMQRLTSAQRIYSPATQTLFSTMAVLFTGFISSIVAGVAVRVNR
jgi:hypothetical protein